MNALTAKIGFIGTLVFLLSTSFILCPGLVRSTIAGYFDLAVDEPRQRLYGSDQNGGTIHVISTLTPEVISIINVGSQPSGIDISPDGNELAVALCGQGDIAFIDLNTLSIVSRVVGPNHPYDVLYGRPGRLYATGNPGPYGGDRIHVFDTKTKTEIGGCSGFCEIRLSPRLAITGDKNTLYVTETSVLPQQIYRFDITTDTVSMIAMAPHGPVTPANTICTSPDGRIFTSSGQVWSADLTTLLFTLPYSGGEIECSKLVQKVYIGSGTTMYVFDSNNYSPIWNYNLRVDVGVARLNQEETFLYIDTNGGVKALGTEFKPRLFAPLIMNKYYNLSCTGGPGSPPSLYSVTISPNSGPIDTFLHINLILFEFNFYDPNGDMGSGTFNWDFPPGQVIRHQLPENLTGIKSGLVFFIHRIVTSNQKGTFSIPTWLVDKAGNCSNIVYVDWTQY